MWKDKVTGLILAGGEGRRMEGKDKGWVELQGLPLVKRAIERVQPQVNQLLISANRNIETYQQLGHTVVKDETPFLGPLAGILAGLQHIETEYALVVPTDAPLIPDNLVSLLSEHLPKPLVLCRDHDRLQPLFGLYHHSLAPSIQSFLGNGERKLMKWCEQHEPAIVTIRDKTAFTNLNTPHDLKEFEKKIPN